MTDLNSRSLAEIVNADHNAASVFEKNNLDFCCKGKRSLQQACEEKSLPVGQVIAELQAASSSCQTRFDFDSMPLPKLADYIVFTHHEYVKKEMPQIAAYLQKIATKHGDRHPEMFKVYEAFSTVKEEMEEHMQKEELILFPRIKAIGSQSTEKPETDCNSCYLELPINMMEDEHENAGRLMEQIRQLTNNYTPPADACTTYRLSFEALQTFERDLHQHVHLENNILFPKAMEAFHKLTEARAN